MILKQACFTPHPPLPKQKPFFKMKSKQWLDQIPKNNTRPLEKSILWILAKEGPNAVNFAIAEMISELLTL